MVGFHTYITERKISLLYMTLIELMFMFIFANNLDEEDDEDEDEYEIINK